MTMSSQERTELVVRLAYPDYALSVKELHNSHNLKLRSPPETWWQFSSARQAKSPSKDFCFLALWQGFRSPNVAIAVGGISSMTGSGVTSTPSRPDSLIALGALVLLGAIVASTTLPQRSIMWDVKVGRVPEICLRVYGSRYNGARTPPEEEEKEERARGGLREREGWQ